METPGLKWRKRVGGDVPYWIAPAKDIKAGYEPKSVMLDATISAAEIAALCQQQWADLEAWRKDKGYTKRVRYTIAWLIDRFLTDEHSPFHAKTEGTRQSYGWECKRIRETVGDRRIDPKLVSGVLVPGIVGQDIRNWHHKWGHPKDRPPTPSRARHCIMMFRSIISYGVEIGVPGAEELLGRLRAMRFASPAARTKAPTYEQVDAIVNKAETMGLRSIAIATLAQYELIERRVNIIGQRQRGIWQDGWVWENVSPDWVIRYFQTKKGRVLREYDLKPVQRLLGLMQETPKEDRTGPIIICEATGKPWELRRYQATFRKIARAAGVADDVQSMDMRSGGGTEASLIPEVTDRQLQNAFGHADPRSKERYLRNKQHDANVVVDLRQAKRDKK